MAEKNIVEKDFTTEETKAQMAEREDDLLASLLEASQNAAYEETELNIVRNGKHYFSFRIHPLTDEKMQDIRKKYTKYTKNRRTGVIVSQELDLAKFRSSLIYNSTIDSDRERLWDNKKLWEGLRQQGKTIINALDVIEAVLLPGEKEYIVKKMDDIAGYNIEDGQMEEEQIEIAKN